MYAGLTRRFPGQPEFCRQPGGCEWKNMKKIIVITGASSGIGRASALRFASPEHALVLCARKGAEALRGTAETAAKAGSEVLPLLGDVADPDFDSRLVDETLSRFGRIDLLVNNAGISHIGLLQEMDPADIDRMIQVNLLSVIRLCRAVIPPMVRAQSGRIINVSSVWGSVGASCEAVYSASKGGVNSFTKALAKELAPSGIAVNAVAFGAIDTRMNRQELSEEDLQALADEIPMGRLGTAEEAARMIELTASAPLYLTGQVITMDGGWT